MGKEAKRIRRAFETYRLMNELGPCDWPDPNELRRVAKRLGVPYLMLLLEFYVDVRPQLLKLSDIEEWNAATEAQRVLEEAWTEDREHEKDRAAAKVEAQCKAVA